MIAGKTVLITGSTGGIGYGIAQKMASAGCNVMLNGFGDKNEIEEKRAALEKDHNIKAEYNAADMTKPSEIRDMIKSAADVFGSLDILVNNAGIQYVSPIEEFPEDKWNAIIAINLSSSFHTIQNSVPLMKKQGWGRIINIASAHALVASPYKSAYVAAKHGMAGLTKTIALETAEHNITCNAICPGYVWTPLVEGQVKDTAKARGMTEEQVKTDVLLAAQPTKKFVEIDDVASIAEFLCSDSASNITGSLLQVDGGWASQ